ncbi:MAG: hypothetical protein ACR2FH_02755 [Caulobacteraceae bacterium]
MRRALVLAGLLVFAAASAADALPCRNPYSGRAYNCAGFGAGNRQTARNARIALRCARPGRHGPRAGCPAAVPAQATVRGVAAEPRGVAPLH